MRIACVSLDPKWEDKKSNLKACSQAIQYALNHLCSLILFPEMTLTGFSMNTAITAEEPETSETIQFFQKEAQKGTHIIFGMALKSHHDITNNLVLVSSAEEVLSSYAKIHPFSITQEGSYYEEGHSIVFKLLKEISLGFTICYDLRFPEIYQSLSNLSDVIVNIANWPETRKDHWITLLKARAIENQVFMIGVNRTGTDGNGIKYFRGSQVFDPDGNPVPPIDTWGDVDIFELNLSLVRKTRESFPVKHDRKNKFYKCLY